MNHRLQSLVNGTVFAIALGWLLYIGRDILVPVVFSVLVVYVILGLARLLARIPVVGRKEPTKLHYAASIALIVLCLFAGASLMFSQMLRVGELAPQPGIGDARAPHRGHHHRPAAPAREHLGDQLGRMLQVAVHQHDHVARRRLQAGGHRGFLAEVAREADRLEVAVAGTQRGDARVRVVAATVVYADDVPVRQLQPREHLRQAPVQRLHRFALVVERDHDRESGVCRGGGRHVGVGIERVGVRHDGTTGE